MGPPPGAPSGPPPGGFPPPGQPGDPMQPPQAGMTAGPVAQGGGFKSGGSGIGKIVLIGCLVIVVLGLLAGGGLVVAIYILAEENMDIVNEVKNSPEFQEMRKNMPTSMEEVEKMQENFSKELDKQLDEGMGAQMDESMGQLKESSLQLLSKKATGKQKKRFAFFLDKVLIEERKRLGAMKWSMTYQGVMTELGTMSSDGAISVKESVDWSNKAAKMLKKK